MPRTKLRRGQTQTSKEEGGSTARTTAQIERYYSGGGRKFTYKKNDRGRVIKVELKGGGMSSGQAAIAAKAPPPNKIDAKDFAVLRQEKAKGRGMGLQDEKVQPGKVMKAKRGKLFQGYLSTFDASAEASTPKAQRGVTTIVGVRPGAKIGKGKKTFKSMEAMRTAKGFKTINGKQETSSEFNKRRMKLAGAKKALASTRVGKIALAVGTAGVGAAQYLKSKMNKKNNKTLKDARLQKKPGIPSETTQKINKALSNIKTVKLKKKMGGGMMMQKPMGYIHGTKPGSGPLARTGRERRVGEKGRERDPARKRSIGRRLGLGALNAAVKGKEDSSVTLGKFMKAKIDSTNKSIKGGGMKADRVTEGSGYRNKRGFRKDVEEGKYKQEKDADYYKRVGLTGKRGDQAVDDFFKPYHMRSDAIKLKSGGMKKPMGYKSGGMDTGRVDETKSVEKRLDSLTGHSSSKGGKPTRKNTPKNSFNMGGMMMQKPMGYSKGSKKPMGYMSGGMMKPMGYKHGTSVTAKCKLGRNKPTKIT